MVFVEVYTGLGIDCPQSSKVSFACSVDATSEIRRRAPCAAVQSVFSAGDSEKAWKVIFTTNPSGTVIFQKQVEPGGVSLGKLRLEKSPEVPLITSGEAHAAKKTNKQTSIAAIAGSHICHICQLSRIMRESPGYSFCVTCSKIPKSSGFLCLYYSFWLHFLT